MEKTLCRGDLLFISKIAYGIYIPFSSIRIFPQAVSRNDIVLLNVPNLNNEKQSILSRCVALPGDSIMFMNGDLFINGKKEILPPSCQYRYYNNKPISRFEAYILSEQKGIEFPDSSNKNISTETILLPKAGDIMALDTIKTRVYASIFKEENPGKKVYIDHSGSLYINNEKQNLYLFQKNYYWVLSDNRVDGYDSRDFGLVPEQNIKAKALNVWMNLNFLSLQ